MAAIALAALIVFIAGLSAGVIVVVSAGIHREQRDLARRREEPDFTVTVQAPDRMTKGARLVAGLHVLNQGAGADHARRETMLV
jgi:hypothetical protein